MLGKTDDAERAEAPEAGQHESLGPHGRELARLYDGVLLLLRGFVATKDATLARYKQRGEQQIFGYASHFFFSFLPSFFSSVVGSMSAILSSLSSPDSMMT